MGNLSVRVAPGSRDVRVEVTPAGVVVRVRTAPEAGRATDEARRAIAKALDAPPSSVRLLRGARSREKVFEIDGMTGTQALQRIHSPRS